MTSVDGAARIDAGVSGVLGAVGASSMETGVDRNEEDGSDEVVCDPEWCWEDRKRCIV